MPFNTSVGSLCVVDMGSSGSLTGALVRVIEEMSPRKRRCMVESNKPNADKYVGKAVIMYVDELAPPRQTCIFKAEAGYGP